MNPGEILQVNFQKLAPPPVAVPGKKRGFIHQGGGDYVDLRNGHHYENPRINGRYTWRKLSAITHAAALKEIRKKRSEYESFKLGLSKQNPYAPKTEVQTVGDLLDQFADAGFPKRRSRSSPRNDREIAELKRHIANLKTFFARLDPANRSAEDLHAYHAHRLRQIAKKSPTRKGHRAVDKEVVTLSLAYEFAIDNCRSTGVTANPFARKIHFCDAKSVKHCRDFQPANADELHRLAAALFESMRSEPLGWQLLFEAMIGQRSHEILRLRMDAKTTDDPGFVEKNCLYLFRSNTSKGTYPYAAIHPALRACLEAHRHWHDRRFPRSPWYFPSPDAPRNPLGPSALTHALARVTSEMGLPKRTSHGLRSYFVNVLRTDRRPDGTHKYTDAEIALRIGQRTQGKLILDVYGEIPPHQLTWLPESDPAWQRWLPDAPTAEQLTLGLGSA